MSLWITSFLFAAVLVLVATAATAADRDRSPTTRAIVLMELFTSEGCSSCPPADALLAELSKPDAVQDVTIVPLALHVDYWNRQGWTDPYSSARFTERQERYVRCFRLDSAYTPQMVIDGVSQFVGSDRAAARQVIIAAVKQPKGTITVRPAGAAALDAKAITAAIAVTSLPAITKGDVADVIVAITEDDLTSAVTRGENAGRSLPHTAIVRELRTIGVIDPAKSPLHLETKCDMALKEDWRREKLKVVAFVQERYTRRVLAIGIAPISRD